MKQLNLTKPQIIIGSFLLLLLGLSFALFLSLISYDPTDSSWSQASWDSSIHNICGYTGAYVADICLQFLGFIAFTLPLFFITLCIQLMIYVYQHEYRPINYFKLSFRIIGFFAFIFSAAAFFSINIIDSTAYQAGGIIGDIIATTLLPAMDHVSASFLLLIIAFACITLITDVSWLYLLEKLGNLVITLAVLAVRMFFSVTRNQDNSKKRKRQSAISEQKLNSLVYEQPARSLLDDRKRDDVNSSEIELDLTAKHRKYQEEIDVDLTTENSPELLSSISHELNSAHHLSEATDRFTNDDRINDNTVNEERVRDYTIKEYVPNDFTLSDPIIPIEDNHDTITRDTTIGDATSDDTPTQSNAHLFNKTDIDNDHNDELALFPEPMIRPEPDYIENDDNLTLTTIETDNIDPFINYHEADDIEEHNNEENNKEDTDKEHDIEKQNSLIHPLLRRNDKPLTKPTTPMPSLDLLTSPPIKQIDVDHGTLGVMSELIEQSLADYRVKTKVVDYQPGPVITRFEIELAPGIKAARISTLDRDLARSLSMPSVRVVEVIPGKPYVGIELPNENRQTVYFREVLDSPQFRDSKSPLTIVLGKDIAGQSVVADLAKMPHVLVAGTTGSGKSVGVNAMILSILYKSQPEDVRFIMIDPKMLELSVYEGIPHLLTPVVTDMKDAANALNWCVNEMERRYRLMSALGVRNIAGYNEKINQAAEMGHPIPDPLWKPTDSMDLNMPRLEKLPYIVVLVDEFADLIMAVGKKVEELIARLAQKARAAGIHLVLATQRPSVDVITGLIKANIPTRIAFTVSSKIDSRTILDQMGAESLLGMGDMLYLAPNSSIPVRVHGAFVRDEEVHAVVQDWKARGEPKYVENITAETDEGEASSQNSIEEELDPLFDQVVSFVIETQRASISSVQRKFRIGYNRAARIVEQMENEGIISSPSHNGNREVLSRPHDRIM